jgi:polyferredoxin
MKNRKQITDRPAALIAIKVLHTVVWAFLAACIFAIPVASRLGSHRGAALLTIIVLAEVLVLAVNGWKCPLTSVAERFTEDRHDSFDIYLPGWLARNNKLIFTILFVGGLLYALGNWLFG